MKHAKLRNDHGDLMEHDETWSKWDYILESLQKEASELNYSFLSYLVNACREEIRDICKEQAADHNPHLIVKQDIEDLVYAVEGVPKSKLS